MSRDKAGSKARYTIRSVQRQNAQEVQKISELVNSAYRGDSSKRGWTTEADYLGGQRTDPEMIQEMLAKPSAEILVLENDKFFLGCVYLEKQADRMYLGMLTVNPSLQNKGFGNQLLVAAEKSARSQNLKFIEMWVISLRESLINYYLRRGYKLTGKRWPFPAGNPRMGLPKLQNLEFVVLEKQLL